MKHRKLIPRGLIRYFRDDKRENLWRWANCSMTRRYTNENGQPWDISIRLPHKEYSHNWREITEKQAKRSFLKCFNDEKEF